MGFTLVQINNLITGNTLAAEVFIANGWDVTEDILTEDTVLDMIQGIPKLEDTLGYYLDDFSALEPEWKCENPL